MSGLNLLASQQNQSNAGLNSFPALWSAGLDDFVLSLAWSADGAYLAVLPSDRAPVVFEATGRRVTELPPHRGGNGSLAWHPHKPLVATYGQDGAVRIFDFSMGTANQANQTSEPKEGRKPCREFPVGRGWAEHLAWNADGSLIAAVLDRELLVWEASSGQLRQRCAGHPSTICHLAWNPAHPLEVATVGDGGARMWRMGEEAPFTHFDWGGASLQATWSADGRWLVTADQTPSLHLFDFTRHEPLHIQGFEGKVKAMSWQRTGRALATTNAEGITVWPCTGERGPEGATPLMLTGHRAPVTQLAFCGSTAILASGDQDGTVLLWSVGHSDLPALLARTPAEITALAWSPDERSLVLADAEGLVTVCRLPDNS